MNSHLQKATSVASWDRNRHFMSTSVIYEFNYFESIPHMNFIFFLWDSSEFRFNALAGYEKLSRNIILIPAIRIDRFVNKIARFIQ